jgi:hypothetical protein
MFSRGHAAITSRFVSSPHPLMVWKNSSIGVQSPRGDPLLPLLQPAPTSVKTRSGRRVAVAAPTVALQPHSLLPKNASRAIVFSLAERFRTKCPGLRSGGYAARSDVYNRNQAQLRAICRPQGIGDVICSRSMRCPIIRCRCRLTVKVGQSPDRMQHVYSHTGIGDRMSEYGRSVIALQSAKKRAASAISQRRPKMSLMSASGPLRNNQSRRGIGGNI